MVLMASLVQAADKKVVTKTVVKETEVEKPKKATVEAVKQKAVETATAAKKKVEEVATAVKGKAKEAAVAVAETTKKVVSKGK